MTLFTSAALKVRPERPVWSEPPPPPSCRRRRRPLPPGHSPRRATAAANRAAAPPSHRLRISTTISVGGNPAHAAGSERRWLSVPPSLCAAGRVRCGGGGGDAAAEAVRTSSVFFFSAFFFFSRKPLITALGDSAILSTNTAPRRGPRLAGDAERAEEAAPHLGRRGDWPAGGQGRRHLALYFCPA